MKSNSFQASTIFPSFTRTIVMPLNSTGLFVGVTPSPCPVMRPRDTAAGRNLIAVDERVLNRHPQVRIGGNKRPVQCLKSIMPAHRIAIRAAQPVGDAIFGHHLL